MKQQRRRTRHSRDYVVAPVLRAMTVLRCVGEAPGPISLKAIAAASGVPKSTTFRYLQTLCAAGMVSHDKMRTIYRIDPRIIGMLNLGGTVQSLRETCLPAMRELQAAFDETVNLGVLEGSQVVYVEIIESTRSLRFHAAVGGRDPAYTTALGKALLAFLPPEARAVALPRTLRRRTDRTIIDRAALLAELEAIRARRYAVDAGENEEGAVCFGAPIFGLSGAAVAGISLSMPAVRLNDRLRARIVARLLEAADRLSRGLRS
jgi:IclR family acetate operon transcriptional repressor